MNNWNGVGRTTKEPETRYTQAAEPMAVSKFTIAIDAGYGEKKKTNFVPVVCFGKTAEYVERFLRKGKLVAVQGEYTTGSYEKQDGTKVYTTNINASKVQVLEYEKTDDNTSSLSGENGIPEGFQALDDDEFSPF